MKMKTQKMARKSKVAGIVNAEEKTGAEASDGGKSRDPRPVAAGSKLEAGYGASEGIGSAESGAAVAEGLARYNQAQRAKSGGGNLDCAVAPGVERNGVQVRRTVKHCNDPEAEDEWSTFDNVLFEVDLGNDQGKAVVDYAITSDGKARAINICHDLCEFESEIDMTEEQALALAGCLKAAALDHKDYCKRKAAEVGDGRAFQSVAEGVADYRASEHGRCGAVGSGGNDQVRGEWSGISAELPKLKPQGLGVALPREMKISVYEAERILRHRARYEAIKKANVDGIDVKNGFEYFGEQVKGLALLSDVIYSHFQQTPTCENEVRFPDFLKCMNTMTMLLNHLSKEADYPERWVGPLRQEVDAALGEGASDLDD